MLSWEDGWRRGPALVYSAAQSYPTLCDPRDCNLPGSSVHGILQARILEWVDVLFSKGSSQPRDLTRVSCFAGGSSWKVRRPNFHVVLDKFSI